jgi:hypothetical protein
MGDASMGRLKREYYALRLFVARKEVFIQPLELDCAA